VTLPQIRGVILIMLLLQIIGTLQLFTEPALFTKGGPNGATVTVLLLIYEYAFESRDFGAASALSVLLAGALGIFSIVYYAVTRRWSTDP
jgi:multiple sugar transport system permease protein